MLSVVTVEPPLLFAPHSCLRHPAHAVEAFDDSLVLLAASLKTLLEKTGTGVGVAAPQVGVLRRVCVVHLPGDQPLVLCNPRVTSSSEATDTREESCLSVPRLCGPVERAKKVSIEYENHLGETNSLSAKGFMARLLLHELDHLDGVLWVDRVQDRDTIHPCEELLSLAELEPLAALLQRHSITLDFGQTMSCAGSGFCKSAIVPVDEDSWACQVQQRKRQIVVGALLMSGPQGHSVARLVLSGSRRQKLEAIPFGTAGVEFVSIVARSATLSSVGDLRSASALDLARSFGTMLGGDAQLAL